MILLGILFYLCFDTVCSFPSKNCNAKTKYLLFFLDCRDEVEAQSDLMDTVHEYFKSLSKTNQVFFEFRMIITDGNYDLVFTPGFKCNQSLPVDRTLNESRYALTIRNFLQCTPLKIAIIFIFNLTKEELGVVIKTIDEERNRNINIQRFFIIQTSETITIDYIYSLPSFGSLKLEDLLMRMCDMRHEDVVFLYSGGKYFDTKYYQVTDEVVIKTNHEAACYCDEYYGLDLISLETYDEGVFISQVVNNLSMKNEVNMFLTLGKFKRERHRWLTSHEGVFTFLPHMYVRDESDCFYINISSYRVGCLGKSKCSLESFIEKLECNQSMQNTLVFCEHNDIPDFQSIPSHELFKTSQDINVFNRKSLDDFRNMLFSAFDSDGNPNTNQVGNWKISNQHCTVNKMYIYYSLGEVERYLCSYNLSHNVDNDTEKDLNTFINILSTDRYSIFKLKQLDVSMCSNYNECQRNVQNKTATTSNAEAKLYCLDDGEDQYTNGTCAAQVIDLNLSLEYFQCESNESQTFYKCLKNEESQCEDNSNLLNCENFTCPEPFFKCPNSFCIFPFQISDEIYDCRFGEDDFWVLDQYRSSNAQVAHPDKLNFRFVLKDICMDSFSYEFLLALTNERSFICDNACPQNYQCISSKSVHKDKTGTEGMITINIYSVEMEFLNVYNSFYPQYNFYKFLPLISIVQLKANIFRRGFNNFDQGFSHWNFNELALLDLNLNEDLIHSDYFTSISSFRELKYLNLSGNRNRIIDHKFSFPRSLEVIDLSYTKTSALSRDVFDSLTFLKHLNLSYTLISTFEDMGIPKYFTLETFYIKGLQFNYLEPDFFKGLSVKFELQTSYYVMCCPMILNPAISVDKCHAPIDVISSCKHLVGDTLKRIVIWIVGFLTIVGNGMVLVYRIGWNRDIFNKAYGLFISGLAVSDFIMGVYLIGIAFVDTYYKDVYVLKDYTWRNGFLCHLLGFLSTLSSETSTFFVCLITVDRFLSVTYPFGEHRFNNTGKLLSFTLVWLVGLIVALLPIVLSDWEIYSSNGLCLALPFSSKIYKGWIFSFVVFVVLNFVLFLLIAIGQLTIFLSLLSSKKPMSKFGGNTQRRSKEWNVAKKLAFVALTDFFCWFPVGILGMLSLQGYIFNREVYAWIAVFVLPINSALNPIIYTLPAVYSFCNP